MEAAPVEEGTDVSKQFARLVRFLEDRIAACLGARDGDSFRGIASGEDNGQIRASFAHLGNGGEAADARHEQIHDGERNGWVPAVTLQGADAVAHGDDCVAGAFERKTGGLAEIFVIFDEEDCFASVSRGRSRAGILAGPDWSCCWSGGLAHGDGA